MKTQMKWLIPTFGTYVVDFPDNNPVWLWPVLYTVHVAVLRVSYTIWRPHSRSHLSYISILCFCAFISNFFFSFCSLCFKIGLGFLEEYHNIFINIIISIINLYYVFRSVAAVFAWCVLLFIHARDMTIIVLFMTAVIFQLYHASFAHSDRSVVIVFCLRRSWNSNFFCITIDENVRCLILADAPSIRIFRPNFGCG